MSSDDGMKLWSRIISLPTWYQTREEIELLEHCGLDIAAYVPTGALVSSISGVGKSMQFLSKPFTCLSTLQTSICHSHFLKTTSKLN